MMDEEEYEGNPIGFSITQCYKCGNYFNWYDVSCPVCGTPAGWNEKNEKQVKNIAKLLRKKIKK